MDKSDVIAPVAIFLGIIAAIWIIALTGFGIIKVGSNMFDSGPASLNTTETNIKECWAHGGSPVMDTNGDYDDFKTCQFNKETK